MKDSFYFPWKEVSLKESSLRHPNTCRKRIEMIYNNIEIYFLALYQNRTVSVSKPNWLTLISVSFSLIII